MDGVTVWTGDSDSNRIFDDQDKWCLFWVCVLDVYTNAALVESFQHKPDNKSTSHDDSSHYKHGS